MRQALGERPKRLAVVVPVALLLIFGMLLWNFGDIRYAVAVYALTGGMVGLVAIAARAGRASWSLEVKMNGSIAEVCRVTLCA